MYEFTGKILTMSERSGQSQRGGWKMWECVMEHDLTGQYPRRVVFNVWDETVQNTIAFCHGGDLQCRICVTVDARESNGRWFNDIRAFRADPIHAQQYQQYQQPVYGPPVAQQHIPSQQPCFPVAPGYAQGQGNGGNNNGNPPF